MGKISNVIGIFVLALFCLGKGEIKMESIHDFELAKYLGLWYEIARLPASFEKNLTNVTATYSLKENGTVKVENQGTDSKTNAVKKATGKAKFAGNPTIGYLKVSFFGPFYGDYKIIQLDKDYKYALVYSSKKYAWILSREKTMEKEILDQYLNSLKEFGIDTTKLIFSQQ